MEDTRIDLADRLENRVDCPGLKGSIPPRACLENQQKENPLTLCPDCDQGKITRERWGGALKLKTAPQEPEPEKREEEMVMLKCSKCGRDKPETEFPHDMNCKKRNFRGYWCRECLKNNSAKIYEKKVMKRKDENPSRYPKEEGNGQGRVQAVQQVPLLSLNESGCFYQVIQALFDLQAWHVKQIDRIEKAIAALKST